MSGEEAERGPQGRPGIDGKEGARSQMGKPGDISAVVSGAEREARSVAQEELAKFSGKTLALLKS